MNAKVKPYCGKSYCRNTKYSGDRKEIWRKYRVELIEVVCFSVYPSWYSQQLHTVQPSFPMAQGTLDIIIIIFMP